MPTYDYLACDPARSCDHCREAFEVMHGMNEPGPEACPKCGAPVKKGISLPQISAGRWSSKRLLSKDNLQKHGFETGSTALEKGKLKLD